MSSSTDPYAELASLFLTEDPVPSAPLAERRVRGEIDPPPRPIPIRSPWGAGSRADVAPLSQESSAASAGDHRAARNGDEALPRHVGAPIEIAIVGNLPVMGALWLTQYADQIARREGPTALVRLERGQVTLELMRDPAHRGFLDSAESAEAAILSLAGVAKRWIICPGSEAALDGPLPGDALSLLTGGDDAATVNAYRIMKNLAERWHAAHWPVPPIGLVVLGASPDRVDEVAEKLDRTTKAFLDVDISVTSQQQRMDTIDSASRRTFAGSELTVHDVVRRIRKPCAVTHPLEDRSLAADLVEAEAAPSSQPLRDPLAFTMSKLAPKPSPRQPARAIGRPVEADERAVEAPRPMDAPPTAVPPREVAMQASSELPVRPPLDNGGLARPESDAAFLSFTTDDFVGRVELRPDVRPDVRPVHIETARAEHVETPTPPRTTTLASHLPGLHLLPLQPPGHAHVELARDDAGRLHLVVSDRHLASLRPAEAWARAHADLLRIAFPDLHAQDDAVTLDVVTLDAPSIIPLHGTGLRLHLLVETPAGCQHVALNRA